MSSQTNTPIIPRFEFRIFGRDLGLVHEKLKALSGIKFFEQDPIQSVEYYLLSRTNDTANCKIRNEQIDIKTLVGEDEGLEQWTVLLKTGFPLLRRQLVKEVFPALWTRAPLLRDGFYNLNQFIDITLKNTDIQILNVEKNRYRYRLDDTIFEFAQVFVNGAKIETAAVESENMHLVLDRIKKLDIATQENLNYQKALKRVIGWDGLKKIE